MQRKDLLRYAKDRSRNLARRLPEPARRRVNRALESNLFKQVVRVAIGAQRRETGPLVTIVVPVYNVAQYLPDFLDSVVGQTYRNLEILVVDDGSPDESAAIARRWGRWDRRIRVISKTNGGLGDARNAGLQAARGKYITFADSDDVLAPNGIRAMVETLEASGSDFVVGTMVRARGEKTWLPQWTRRVHSMNRIGITIDEFPEVLLDVFACNKIWNTDFFRRNVNGFPVGVAYEDQEPSVKSYLNAEKFDVIKDHVYFWRIRDDGSSITQQKAKLSDLRDRIKVSLAVAEQVTSSDHETVRRGWYRKIFGTDLIQYIEQVPRTGPEYFAELCDGYQAIIGLCEDDFWRDVATYPKLAAWCVLNRDYDSLMEVIAGHVERGRGYQLSRNSGVLSARPLYLDRLERQPDDAVFETRDEYLDLVSKVTKVEWATEDEIVIGGHAFVRSSFEPDESTKISIVLINSVTGERIETATTQMSDPTLNATAHTEARDCTDSAFESRINASELNFAAEAETAAGRPEEWKVAVSVEFGDVRREEYIRDIADDAGAAYLGHTGMGGAGRVVALSHDQQEGLRFRLAQPKTVARDFVLRGRRLTVSVKSLVDSDVSALVLRSRVGRNQVQATRDHVDAEGFAHFTVTVPKRSSTVKRIKRSRWDVYVVLADGTRRMVHAGLSSQAEATSYENTDRLMIDFDPRGYLRLDEWPSRFTAESLRIDRDSLLVSGHFLMPDSTRNPSISLVGESYSAEPHEFDWSPETGEYTARFELSRDDWYGKTVSLPVGVYAVRGEVQDDRGEAVGNPLHAFIPAYAASDFPLEGATDLARVKITRTRKAFRPWIRILPSLQQDELGLFNRRAMIEEAQTRKNVVGLSDSIVFESYHGKQISDSCRSLFDWVVDERPDIDCYWSVSSHAVSVPDGATAVVHGSREWFDALTTSRYLVNNSNFPGYFRTSADQKYLQTWHGTPMKKIAEDMPPANLSLGYRVLMRREARAWDALLAQNDFAAATLPSAFRYDGPTLNLGYPRNDVLVGEAAELARTVARARLGISDEQFVVMYAPTFRDNVKAIGGGYAFESELDIEQLLSMLPEQSVVLVRGHANTTGANAWTDNARVIDVSSYGEISELFAASDALVTDYSSMMFDYIVTRKPLLFYVPDLEEYESSTRGFYLSFREICPGPMHKDTRSLALDLQRAWSNPSSFIDDRYSEFAETFAPRDDGNATERVIEVLQARGWFA